MVTTEQHVKEFLDIDNEEERTKYYLDHIYRYNLYSEFHHEIKKYLAFQEIKLKRYFYMITFTLNDENKDQDEKKIQKYIMSRVKRSALHVLKAHIVNEKTSKGTPHWHVAVESSKYISKDRFKYYTKQYGFVDISKNHSQNYETIMKYISKESKPIQFIGGKLE